MTSGTLATSSEGSCLAFMAACILLLLRWRRSRQWKYLAGFANLQLIGRNGQHRYNNQDHSMVTGLQAAGNLFGEDHDLWAVNTERSHHEAQPP